MYQWQLNQLNFFKCNQRGKGYIVRSRDITTFEERVLFLKSSGNEEWNYEKNPVPKIGTSGPAQASWNLSPASRVKRKVGSQTKENDSASKNEMSAKRIKNGSKCLSQEEEETSVEELLFSNDLLLRTIFANLDVEDLKSCRLVNSLWNFEATKILLKRDCLAAIQISSNTVTIQDSAEFKHPTTLEDFLNIFTNSNLFPSTFFAVHSDRLSRNVIEFFRENGHLVKSFCFDTGHPGPGSVEELDANAGNILLLAATCFPNLTKLKVTHVYQDMTNVRISLAIELIPELKNLHTLDITGAIQQDVVSQIAKKASNLKNIYFHRSENLEYVGELDTLIKCGNVVPRLKNIHLFLSARTLDTYKELLKQKPRFSSIEAITVDTCVPLVEADAGRFLRALFQECSESLEEIVGVKRFVEHSGLRPPELHVFGLHFPGLSFPVFSNVKKLRMDVGTLQNLGVNLAEIFPNLATFELDCTWVWKPKESLEGALSPLLSVRHLQVNWADIIDGYLSEFWVKALCTLCPNVTSAAFYKPLEASAYEHVWKLKKLQDLHVEIRTEPMTKLCALDSAFTGFSVETAKNLYKLNADYWSLSGEVESMRIKPSIVDLKELRRLSIRLCDSKADELDAWPWEEEVVASPSIVPNVDVIFDPGEGKALLKVDGKILLSYITKRFAFDLCSRLQSNVSLRFTHYTSYYNSSEHQFKNK